MTSTNACFILLIISFMSGVNSIHGSSELSEHENGSSKRSLVPRSSNEEVAAGDEKHGEGLTEADLNNVKNLLTHRLSENTRSTYQQQWKRFVEWALVKGLVAMPANQEAVAAYLAGRMEDEGHKPATLKSAASAIGYVHRASGLDDSCASQEVKGVLSGATRKMGKKQKQAKALTSEMLAKIHAVAYEPRTGRGGWSETKEEARRRGSVEMALPEPLDG